MSSLRALIDQASGYAETLFDPDDVMMPRFVAEASDGSITIAALAVGGRDLDRYRKHCELRFRAEGYRRWVFMAESWLAEYAPGAVVVDPQDSPERVEIIQFDGFDAGGNRRLRAHRQILRLTSGVQLMPLVIPQGPSFDAPTRPSRKASAGARP